MLNKEELELKTKSAELNLFEVSSIPETEQVPWMFFSDIKNNIKEDTEENSLEKLNELIRFAKINGITSIFCSYQYYNLNDYQISDEIIDQYDSRIIKKVKRKIDEYNKRCVTYDYNMPYDLDVFCFYSGLTFDVEFTDDWLQELGSENKMEELLGDDCIEEIHKISDEMNDKKAALKAELINYIFTDPTFVGCTNRSSRKNYIFNLLKERKEFEHALGKFVGIGTMVEFIEDVWREHKANN